MPYVNVEGNQIYYEIHGTGQPFVFLHGLGGSSIAIKNTYRPIDQIQLIVIDLPAHGRSQWTGDQYNFKFLAKVVVKLMNEIGYSTFFLGGISMGAAVSLRIALDFPQMVEKLVLIRSAWINKPMDEQFIELFDLCALHLETKDITGFKQQTQYIKFAKDNQRFADIFLAFFLDRAAHRYPQKFAILPKERPFANWSELKDITCPTLVIANRQDVIHPFEYSEQIAQHLSNSKFFEVISKDVDSSKHLQQLNNHLKSFLLIIEKP